nr:reverse transcriptase domain-containing protein [Tanacetum cinerariifolium]
MKNKTHSSMQNQMNKVKNELRNDMSNQTNELWNIMTSFFQKNTASTSGSGSLSSKTIANPRGDLKAITTRSGVSYDGPPIPPPFSSLPKVVERVPEVTKDTVQPSTENIQPLLVQTQVQIDKPVVAPKPKPTIPYSLRVTKRKLREEDDNLALKFVEIFRKLHFSLSFVDALLHMPKFALMFKSLLNNKEKLFNLTTTLVKENCSAVILKKLPEKLGDPGKFLIPCDFLELVECLALADLVIDYVVDPRVPLILGRPFLRTGRALIDVYGEELTLCVDDEAITLKLVKLQNTPTMMLNRLSGNPTQISEPIINLSSPSLTPFEGGDIILEEIEACLTSKSIPPRIDDTDFDLEGDIRLLEKLLNDDPSSSLLLSKELNVEEIKTVKSSIDEPLELELKELLFHLEYVFVEGTDKLPIIISKELKDEEKSTILKVLMSHKRAIAWKISDIKGIDPRFCTHKILMEDDFKLAVKHQRTVNSKIHKVIKKEVIKLLDVRLIYPISDSPWVSPVHCVLKMGGMIAIENEDNGLIPTRGENLAADHLSRLENLHQDELEKKEIIKTFPLATLGVIDFCGQLFTEMPMTWSHGVTLVNVKAKSHNDCLDFEAYHARDFVHHPLEHSILRIWEFDILDLIDLTFYLLA